MGSLASRPKVPALPQPVVYTLPDPSVAAAETAAATAAATTTAATDTSSAGSSSDTTAMPTPAQQEAAARQSSLLDRSQGVFSTILTGFRGLLDTGNNNGQRKTLLGD
jgi:hypothetical protein